MTFCLGEHKIDPAAFLAPMAGITDAPFRRLVQGFGAGLVFSEMVASQEMVQAKPGVRERAAIGYDAGRTAVQLAGRQAHWMAEAARMAEANGARFVDINMGCPARKVVGGLSGSALMRDPDHALSLIEAVVGAVSVPVSLKMRLGWDESHMNAAELARRATEAGVCMITVHGRTRSQFYSGRANWGAVGDVVRAVPVPVIVNGDIDGVCMARQAMAASGAAGVMLGRAVRGRPWLVAQVAARLFGAPAPRVPEGEEFAAMVARHYEDALAFYGVALGGRVMRKHLGWYMDHAGTPAALRRAVLTQKDAAKVFRLIEKAMIAPRRQEAA